MADEIRRLRIALRDLVAYALGQGDPLH